jgi:phosphoglycolate phosphatase-like HAD superfamily hydrolase
MKIFLFDMDGVLLESHGYHRALQEILRRMGMALGYGEILLTPDEIAAFEAGGITSEWDTAAICTALLLETAWKDEPGCQLPNSLARPFSTPPVRRPTPDFFKLAYKLSTPDMLNLLPLKRAELLFFGKNGYSPTQERTLRDLIRGARKAELSLIHRTFQELILGSAEYTRIYKLPAELECESYLVKYDRSTLSSPEINRLIDWISTPDHAAAVITSRPSRPPDRSFSTPEAEIGAKMVGVDSIPIIGYGGMYWLGLKHQTDPLAFLKPAPVHALAAMRAALGEKQKNALIEAADLVKTEKANASWRQLEGVQVSIFEDSTGGIKSLLAAGEALDKVGLHIQITSYGITRKQVKAKALQALGASIFPSLREALNLALMEPISSGKEYSPLLP